MASLDVNYIRNRVRELQQLAEKPDATPQEVAKVAAEAFDRVEQIFNDMERSLQEAARRR